MLSWEFRVSLFGCGIYVKNGSGWNSNGPNRRTRPDLLLVPGTVVRQRIAGRVAEMRHSRLQERNVLEKQVPTPIRTARFGRVENFRPSHLVEYFGYFSLTRRVAESGRVDPEPVRRDASGDPLISRFGRHPECLKTTPLIGRPVRLWAGRWDGYQKRRTLDRGCGMRHSLPPTVGKGWYTATNPIWAFMFFRGDRGFFPKRGRGTGISGPGMRGLLGTATDRIG